jgi:hypothetical protein
MSGYCSRYWPRPSPEVLTALTGFVYEFGGSKLLGLGSFCQTTRRYVEDSRRSGQFASTVCPLQYSLTHHLSTSVFTDLSPVHFSIHWLTTCPLQYSLTHHLSTSVFTDSPPVHFSIHWLTTCSLQYSMTHRLSTSLFTDSPPVHFSIQWLTPCPLHYSRTHHLSTSLFTDSPPVHFSIHWHPTFRNIDAWAADIVVKQTMT